MRQLAPLPTHPQRQIKLRAASSLGYSLGHSLGLRRPYPEPNPDPNTLSQRRWAEAQRAPKLAAMRATRQKLPAFGSRAEVLASLQAQQSLVVCGETGCGKSTQVPQAT